MSVLFCWLLLLYPRAFRDEYGREVSLALTDRLRNASGPAERAVVWLEAFIGVLREAPKEHLAILHGDLRCTVRSLRQSPGFTFAVIATLALGIGANTAVFSVVDAMLLRPLPYPEAERLVMLWETKRELKTEENLVAPANLFDWRARSRTLERIAMFRPHRVTIVGAGEPLEVQAHGVDRDFFSALGVQPHRGRPIRPADDRPGATPVVVISYRLWQQFFAGDERVAELVLRANARTVSVVGVMPPHFQFMGSEVDIWSPMQLNEARDWRKEAGRFVYAFGRLKPEVVVDAAQRELRLIAEQLEGEHPEFNTGWSVNAVALRDQVAGKVRIALWVLLGSVGLLLIIGCANVVNLLLARAATRQREIAVRLALGANQALLVRQLLTESLLLSFTGAALGLGLAWAGVRLFDVLRPVELGSPNAVAVDSRVLMYSIVLAVGTGVLFGLAPLLTTRRADIQQALKQKARGTKGNARLVRGALVASQCGLTVVLLIGAGLLLRSFVKLQAQDPGLNASNLLTMRVSLPGAAYREPQRRVQFFEQAVDQLKAIPNVQAASATGFLPFTGDAAGTIVSIAGQPLAERGRELMTIVRTVMPGYFEAIGIPVVRGRTFTGDDNRDTTPMRYVVNQEFVRRYLQDRDPLRERISVMMRDQNPYAEIVGVVGDVREGALDKSPEPTVYYVHAHLAYPGMTLVIRTAGSPMDAAASARAVIRSLDAKQPVAEVRTMEEILHRTMTRQRFAAALLTVFSALALLLAALGVYSVLSFVVAERSQEMGVRMALGAQTWDVLSLMVGQGVVWALLGLVGGVGVALLVGRFLRSLLFGVGTADPMTIASVTGLLLLTALFATLLPAWRATRLDPVQVLKLE